ncbi:MAG: 23S rRNA (pseudouridine(1915)-N(3))-methyltransferase RlmH [Bradymonadaceae bacterium]|nr:23S rRNA (pseudouridine(1915)-N(3))-methyltransferase RlmH [Lujinxingiaceae bacterium]
MKLAIVAMGKMRDANLRALTDEYLGRLQHYLPFEEVELREGRTLQDEATAMVGATPAGAITVALNEDGKSLTSEQFARWIEEWMIGGTRHVSFFIGSASGLDADFKRGCQRRLSLSPMTFPHEMARMMLAEQLYRAMSIIRGEPYHK